MLDTLRSIVLNLIGVILPQTHQDTVSMTYLLSGCKFKIYMVNFVFIPTPQIQNLPHDIILIAESNISPFTYMYGMILKVSHP